MRSIKHRQPREEHENMDSQEAARFWRVDEKTLRKMADEGLIPAFRAGRKWLFHRPTQIEFIRNESLRNVRAASENSAPSPHVTAEGGPATNAAADREVAR